MSVSAIDSSFYVCSSMAETVNWHNDDATDWHTSRANVIYLQNNDELFSRGGACMGYSITFVGSSMKISW